MIVAFESPYVFDHSSVSFELLFSFPLITYDPRVTRTVLEIPVVQSSAVLAFCEFGSMSLSHPIANSLHFSYLTFGIFEWILHAEWYH